MRRIIWLLLIVSAAVGVALLMRVSNGNVAILWPPYRIDLSINLAVLILVVLFLLLHLFFGLLSNALNLPARVRDYRERRRRDRALVGLRDSLLAFFEGRFGRAERLARSALSDHALAGSAALIGARSAQRVNEIERRDHWLASAQADSRVQTAWRVVSAEIALDEHQPAEALAALGEVEVRGNKHVHGLRLAMRAHQQLGNWIELLEVVRQLERRDAIEPAAAQAQRALALGALFDGAGDDAGSVMKLWSGLSARERETPEISLAAARAMLRTGRHADAARIVERALDQRYDPDLLTLWPELAGVTGRDRLARAEQWLQHWGEQPALLVALGRLCAGEGLWGKSEEFLLGAERREPVMATRAATQGLLAQLCERLGRQDEADRWYRKAAISAAGEHFVVLAPERLPSLPGQAGAHEEHLIPVVPIPGP